jgi:hypothetical protein
MEHTEIIRRLANNEAMIQGLTFGLDAKQARWQPEPGKWPILEVINLDIRETKIYYMVESA